MKCYYSIYVMWVPVTTEWHVFGMRTQEMASRYGG